jgi:hypothetical protein
MFMPKKQISLPDTIYELLVKYYNNTYNQKFISITNFASNDLSLSNLHQKIIVSPNVNQFSHIQITTKTFKSAITP